VALNPSGTASAAVATTPVGQEYNIRITLISPNEKRYNPIWGDLDLKELISRIKGITNLILALTNKP
jgi:hypothetical protein